MSDLDPRMLDKRVAERYLRAGLLNDKAYEKYLKSLPDLADKGTALEAEKELYAGDVDEPEDAAASAGEG